MKVIQITDEKKEKLSEGLEKMLHIGGKLMQCVESLEEEDDDEEQGEGMRSGYRRGMRGGYRRGGMRNEDEYYGEAEPPMGMRRGGRRSRYEGEW